MKAAVKLWTALAASLLDIALGQFSAECTDCFSIDTNLDSEVSVDELVVAVKNTLNGCGQPS